MVIIDANIWFGSNAMLFKNCEIVHDFVIAVLGYC